MTRDQLKKRLVKIDGKPLRPYTSPRAQLRRETGNVPNVREDDIKFDDFFEFEEDLSEIESARKQFERIEEEKLIQENRKKALGSVDEKDEINESSFIIDFKDDEVQHQPAKAILTDLKKDINFCKFIKDDGEKCKRVATDNFNYCHAHKKYATQDQTINK